MKLLIITQIVDTNNSVLGFFSRWIEEFAKHCDQVTVLALSVGEYHLPENVRVYSLGKNEGRGRITYIVRFYNYVWRMRKNYDAVFVHMNSEYICLGGMLWKILRKRIALWYTHKSVTMKLRIAELLSHTIFTASRESFRLKSKKVQVMGHGIDTDFFTPSKDVNRGNWLLSVGRLMKSKRHDQVIHAAAIADRELRIAGEGPEQKSLEALVAQLGSRVVFLGGLRQAALRDEYQKAAYLIHTSETGSLDKVILEALACGLPVITTNPAFSYMPVIIVATELHIIADAIHKSQNIDENILTDYVKKNHSLQNLISNIVGLMRV